MKIIKPFKNKNDALLSLDNGGRFYNLLTKADDGIISQAELGKVGGIFNDKQKMILFLELSLLRLSLNNKESVLSKLDLKLKTDYLKFKPQNLLPSEVIKKGIVSSNLIVTGIPKLVESKSEFKGFIMIPIMVGKVMTFSMIPLIDTYDVYELRDDITSEAFIIAHSKSSKKLPQKRILVAGVLKELKLKKEDEGTSTKFLETLYQMDVN